MEVLNKLKYVINSGNILLHISNKLQILRVNSLKRYQSSSNHCIKPDKESTSIVKGQTNDNKKWDISTGPDLADFILANSKKLINSSSTKKNESKHPYLSDNLGPVQTVYFDVYGCQMNVNDTEIIWSILKEKNYKRTVEIENADIILIVTCAIRDSAEQKIFSRLSQINRLKEKRKYMRSEIPVKIGLLGCMAERLKNKILDEHKMVDIVAGPDAYRDLPRLLSIVEDKRQAINVALSFDETYADVMPVRLNPDSISAYVSIMRGCDNMCTYCIVPFVRGKERSRPVTSILDEIRRLSDQGIKEVTLLGQNVNSYRDLSESKFFNVENNNTTMARGFKTVYKNKIGGLRFSDLLDKVSQIDPEMRIRFTSPHPKDFPDEVLHLIATRPNICNHIHLPAQSGNSAVLERMRRGYTRESYLELVNHIRNIIPDIKLSSDFIAGFCGETDEEFNDTLTLIQSVQYHTAYLFQYSMREKTTAYRRFTDDVPPALKLERLQKMVALYRTQVENLNRHQVGTHQLVLIEGPSRRSVDMLQGRSDGNTRVLIPDSAIPMNNYDDPPRKIKSGDFIVAQICGSNSNSLTGIPLYHSSITSYSHNNNYYNKISDNNHDDNNSINNNTGDYNRIN
ncbi:hypothetical protein PV325_008191 [Microctonus aethiopoides]|uniref:CDK5RAP1-like protein n=1 Tax=Microctonus aethiopoides TaxID=144406 RepID=A0AA39F1G4_9HYME|nr:hypothetical protein PV325_008191 [Microctonus aethiopoides]KAK0098871.1 hypothetical protein PV326_000806 [Microctonus aethiopoides]KAK0159928.1 hypothetical protein PV328_007388 [Microctonus aethiopoides]